MSRPDDNDVGGDQATAGSGAFRCRACGSSHAQLFVDLGTMPLANSYLPARDHEEPAYPLEILVCLNCFLVQTRDCVSAQDIFSDYAYFSSYSDTWLSHAATYVEMVMHRFDLGSASQVIEVASNDGYLLRNFVRAGIPCLGVEPAANVAEVARTVGVPTETAFFGAGYAAGLTERGLQADLMIANNVLAHVPAINDFVEGFRLALKPHGVATFEFPHFLNMLKEVQFDTIYHEHFSYISMLAAERFFAQNGLMVFDVEELPTHGGSLRLYVQRADTARRPVGRRVETLREVETDAGLANPDTYKSFSPRVEEVREELKAFLAQAAADGKVVAAYGAAAKGNTLLNYCGITDHDIAFCCDRSEQKIGRYLPGSRIPIRPVEEIAKRRPDYVLILPWNLTEEIVCNLDYVPSWGGRFVIAIPRLRLI